MARGMGRRLFAGQLKIFCVTVGAVTLFLPITGAAANNERSLNCGPRPRRSGEPEAPRSLFPLGGKEGGGR